MLARGFTSKSEIQRALGKLDENPIHVTEAQIRRDIQEVQEQVLKEITREPVEKLLMQCAMHGDEVIKQAWLTYANHQTATGHKLQALRLVLEATATRATIMRNLGIIRDELPFGGGEQPVNIYAMMQNIITDKSRLLEAPPSTEN